MNIVGKHSRCQMSGMFTKCEELIVSQDNHKKKKIMGGISRLSINRDTNATEIITASKNQWQSKSVT